MRHHSAILLQSIVVSIQLFALPAGAVDEWTLAGWNDLGMHCMDGSDFSVFSILPPYNTVNAHLLFNGALVTSSNDYHLTYKAVADPNGSFNSTSANKINFWDYENQLFGVELEPDQGLTGLRMPGAANTPQHMHFAGSFNWFTGEGIPISPFDDSGTKNFYPMFRLEAWDAASNRLAFTDVVLPVSDEMHCSACHHSGAGQDARPAAGWIWACDRDHDFKLNVLRLHDENRGGSSSYTQALSAAGYNTDGLYASVRVDAKPVICAQCHRSNALPGMGQTNISFFTSAIHDRHADVTDPDTGFTLESESNRSACYTCHPGSATRCLRGAMGKAIAADGSMAMSCQACHGSMTEVGDSERAGWFDEPNCQSCHTGTAMDNNGQIRYTSVFESPGTPRVAVNSTFATNPDAPPGSGKSLYRFSAGHQDLQCSMCHGSPHAIYPSFHHNDNVQNEVLQGHEGTLAECTACHKTQPRTFLGGPHGMHPVGVSLFSVKTDHQEQWFHGQAKEDGSVGLQSCKACHGDNYRGTVLSRAHADRVIDTEEYGTKHLWRGETIGCYTCHNGPNSEAPTPYSNPTADDVSVVTTANVPAVVTLTGVPNDGSLEWRIVSQPQQGTVALSNDTATYTPFADYVGQDTFTFASGNGFLYSALATGTVDMVEGMPVLACDVIAPTSIPVYVSAPFQAVAALHNATGEISYAWAFGDGETAGNTDVACHRYCEPGVYTWTSIVHAAGVWETNEASLTVVDTVVDEDSDGIGDYWELAWFGRLGAADEGSDSDGDGFLDRYEWPAGTVPEDGSSYLAVTNIVHSSGGEVVITWSSVSNMNYRVLRKSNLFDMAEATVATNLVATPPLNTHTDTPPTASGFYRIGTSLDSGCPALP